MEVMKRGCKKRIKRIRKNIMDQIYNFRKNFSIIGLTGRMGNGCSEFASLLASNKAAFFNKENLRSPEDIDVYQEKNREEIDYDKLLFKKKYEICYNYLQVNWKKQVYIDYKKVVFLYIFHYYATNSDNFQEDLKSFLINEFKMAQSDEGQFDDLNLKITHDEISTIFDKYDLNQFYRQLLDISDDTKKLLSIKDTENLKYLYDLFFKGDSIFNKLYNGIIKLFTSKNYYLRVFFLHKVSSNIRNSGKPFYCEESNSTENVYNLACLINRLIKTFKNFDESKDDCHIVINSLKNSLEIMYFKERYSAFYMVAIHSIKNREDTFNDMVKNPDYKLETVDRLKNLDLFEYQINDFKKGIFSSPDVENCIQKSDIHIINIPMPDDKSLLKHEFATINEQILKYLSLIFQPGIITPSNVERCMQIAFNSKFNSGCISRQVGAIVTNQGFAVKAIGWNDTPKQTIPCLLRSINDIVDGDIAKNDHTYSEFEKPTSRFKYIKKEIEIDGQKKILNLKYINKNFHLNVIQKYSKDLLVQLKSEGKNCSYCFKTLHNEFEGEKNQVHTRSLHAEENAMLQITKHGGQGLKGGYLFVTASPCELCSKKSYQLGIEKIYYIDRYPGISKEHIIGVGFGAPDLIQFKGVVGQSFNKLYESFVSYKDELSFYFKGK